MADQRSESGFDLNPIDDAKRAALAETLSDEERGVLINGGTEGAFCGNLLNKKDTGVYACRLCGLPLFKAGTKFESGTGWPSFYEPFDADHVAELVDDTHGMARTEIQCARCSGHLGHVFPDGPPPTGKRYCLNSVSMEFFPEGQDPPQKA